MSCQFMIFWSMCVIALIILVISFLVIPMLRIIAGYISNPHRLHCALIYRV